ncbi:hypothetical protein LX32DRAFT_652538 [Colletotrichum zoysiae]|uniref:Uncharacterized protein n=1 Tax=Colletotrichum zoysiae TaxID=1216348 RepID=A0AAD9HK12_9PEZI|nr:hypothetical protein LX32DRAFT_652538 [Colletotrichum zoysiae]
MWYFQLSPSSAQKKRRKGFLKPIATEKSESAAQAVGSDILAIMDLILTAYPADKYGRKTRMWLGHFYSPARICPYYYLSLAYGCGHGSHCAASTDSRRKTGVLYGGRQNKCALQAITNGILQWFN